MPDIYDICGYGAGFLFAASLTPQIYKSCKTKDMADISYGWQILLIIALLMSLVYSLHKDLLPVFISSAVELVFMLTLLVMKIMYKGYDKLNTAPQLCSETQLDPEMDLNKLQVTLP